MKNVRLAVFMLLSFLIITVLLPAVSRTEEPVTLFFFYGEGCPHCARAAPLLKELQTRYPPLEVRSFEVFKNDKNLELLKAMAKDHGVEARGVPMFFIGDRSYAGFTPETGKALEAEVKRALANPPPPLVPLPSATTRLEIPFLGIVDTSRLSLPVFTVVIAALDSFNPCAFFVLLFLLSLLVHAHSRKKMLLIGTIFVLSSAVVYFIFMAAWLNFFLLFGHLEAITRIAGAVALLIGAINIKDFFFFHKGVSLTISENAKPKLFARMRGLVSVGSLPGMVMATIALALAANSYEAICTAGFPMVFTRTLTLQHLPVAMYLLYLVFYNLVYVLPLAVIVAVFVITLGSRKLSEWHGRVLKLVSGVMMLGLALVLLIAPTLLNNALLSLLLLIVTVLLSSLIVAIAKRRGMDAEHR